VRYFAAWAGFGLLFFSASTNKLPGYLLPLLPAFTALLGLALARMPRAPMILGSVAALSAVYALAGSVLPAALTDGLRRAEFSDIAWRWLVPSVVGSAAVFVLERRARRMAALMVVLLVVTVNVTILKATAFRVLDAQASSRELWERLKPRAAEFCIGNSHRSIEYGLRYYSHGRIPLCTEEARPIPINLRYPSEAVGEPVATEPGANQ
jgi:4-amino-4-deoxy-L-arabinose transferase-like glycosyltransferase